MRSPGLSLVALVTVVTALASAPAAFAKNDKGCTDPVEDLFGQAPATIADPLDPSLLASYSVLRRPATAADLPPPINALSDQVDFALGRYNPAYIRLLGQRPGGRRFFLVPGFPRHVPVPPARCLPAALGPDRPKLVAEQLALEREPVACVLTMSPHGGRGGASDGPENCPPFRDLTTYEFLSTGVYGGPDHAGILPDGIGAVRVHFSHAAAVQVPVVANFYLYKADPVRHATLIRRLTRIARRLYGRHRVRAKAPRRKLRRQLVHVTGQLSPTSIELLATDGHVVKVVKRPKDDGLDVYVPFIR